MILTDYYVYIYLDPRKPNIYIYGDLKFEYEPFYVGKGRGDRMYHHLRGYNSRNSYLKNKINKIKESGLSPIIIKLISNVNENIAFEKEKEYILKIGRLKNNTGCLVNFSDGGEGQSGFKHTEESKTKIRLGLLNSEIYQTNVRCDDAIKKRRESLKGHVGYGKGCSRTKEDIDKIKSGLEKNPRLNFKHSEKSKKKMSDGSRKGIKNSNTVLYKIKTPSGDVLEFLGKNSVCEYSKSYKLNADKLIRTGEYKNYVLLEKIKVYKEH